MYQNSTYSLLYKTEWLHMLKQLSTLGSRYAKWIWAGGSSESLHRGVPACQLIWLSQKTNTSLLQRVWLRDQSVQLEVLRILVEKRSAGYNEKLNVPSSTTVASAFSIYPLFSRSVLECCVMPFLLYGCKNWIMKKAWWQKLEPFQVGLVYRMLQWPKHYSNIAKTPFSGFSCRWSSNDKMQSLDSKIELPPKGVEEWSL